MVHNQRSEPDKGMDQHKSGLRSQPLMDLLRSCVMYRALCAQIPSDVMQGNENALKNLFLHPWLYLSSTSITVL